MSKSAKTALGELFAAAKAAQANAYAPYSRFNVGAAILTPSGAIYAGCNVENAAYPQGACAEAGAISAMALAGERRIAEILVIGDGDALVTPCGGCRQRIREFAALVFAKWRPMPALATCLLFGFLDALSIRLQGTILPVIGPVPVQAIQALPYVLTVILLAGFIGKAIPPKASGIPYVKER